MESRYGISVSGPFGFVTPARGDDRANPKRVELKILGSTSSSGCEELPKGLMWSVHCAGPCCGCPRNTSPTAIEGPRDPDFVNPHIALHDMHGLQGLPMSFLFLVYRPEGPFRVPVWN